MHIYAFGSICRGEVDVSSDLDLLAIVGAEEARPSMERFSVYRYNRIQELWSEGHPFAWHLHREAKAIFLGDGADFLASLSRPSPYRAIRADCAKLYDIFSLACSSLQK